MEVDQYLAKEEWMQYRAPKRSEEILRLKEVRKQLSLEEVFRFSGMNYPVKTVCCLKNRAELLVPDGFFEEEWTERGGLKLHRTNGSTVFAINDAPSGFQKLSEEVAFWLRQMKSQGEQALVERHIRKTGLEYYCCRASSGGEDFYGIFFWLFLDSAHGEGSCSCSYREKEREGVLLEAMLLESFGSDLEEGGRVRYGTGIDLSVF